MKRFKVWDLHYVDRDGCIADDSLSQELKDGSWGVVRPLRYPSRWNDLKLAWLVFTGKADACIWPIDYVEDTQ